jgi:hypothetical protein
MPVSKLNNFINQLFSLRLSNEMLFFRTKTEHKSVPIAGTLLQALRLSA